MLVVDLLWIVFGIIYVISKLQKEEHIFTKENVRLLLILSAFIIIPQIIVGVVCDEESAEVVRPIVTLVLIILPLLVLCIYGLSFSISGDYNAKKANAELNVRAKQSVQDLRKVFEERGFRNISTQMLEELLNNPISPLQTYGVAGTNLLTCYSWMCKQRTWEIDKLKDNELSCKIGVSLDAIPIDENLPIGEAHLRRTLLAKNYLLTKEGLRYQAFADGLQSRYKAKYLNEDDEYYTTFNRFINEHTSEH